MKKKSNIKSIKLYSVSVIIILLLTACGSTNNLVDLENKSGTAQVTETAENQTDEPASESAETETETETDITVEEATETGAPIEDETTAEESTSELVAEDFPERLEGIWLYRAEYGDYFTAVYGDGTMMTGYVFSDLFPPFFITDVEVDGDKVLLSLHTDGMESDAETGYEGFEAGDTVSTLTSDDDFDRRVYWNTLLMYRVDDNPDNYLNPDNWEKCYETYALLEQAD